MAISYFPLTINVSQIVGKAVTNAVLTIGTNLPAGTPIAFGDEIAVPGGLYRLPGGVGSVNLPTKTGATNVSDWQYVVTGEYQLDGVVKRLAPVYIDAPTAATARNLASFVGVTSVPATFMGAAVAQIQAAGQSALAPTVAAKDAAVAAKNEAVAAKNEVVTKIIADLGTTDGQSKALIEAEGSQTRAALNAAIDGRAKAPRLHYLDTYANLFPNPAWVWKSGQGTTATTASAAASVGVNTVTLTSVTGLSTDVALVLSAGTANQQIRRVASIAGNAVTLTTTLAYPVASGGAVAPLWSDDRHLTAEGHKAYARFIAQAKDSSGNYVISGTAPKVTYLGNSWFFRGGTQYATQLQARIPGATVINAGVEGDESDLLLARFDTDVPADSDYVVINEPGVNDDVSGYTAATQAANLEALWRKARAIGATLVYAGNVPLQPAPAAATARHNDMVALVGDGSTFPSMTPTAFKQSYNSTFTLPVALTKPTAQAVGVGDGALGATPTGAQNTAVGYNSALSLSTGTVNTSVGYASLAACTTGSANTGIGALALRFATGGQGTAVGYQALGALTTGANNTAIGHAAGYSVAGNSSKGTTTQTGQTIVGKEAGGAASNIVAVGYNAEASGDSAVAIGMGTAATANGSVAIGRDNTGTAASTSTANEMALGTANHRVKVAGRLNVAARTPTGAADAQGAVGDLAADDNYVYVKTTAGWKRAALSAW